MPYEPRWDRSLRSLAEFTPAAAASSSDETVVMSRSARAPRARRYTGSRATVASGMPRRETCSSFTVVSPLLAHGRPRPPPLADGPHRRTPGWVAFGERLHDKHL